MTTLLIADKVAKTAETGDFNFSYLALGLFLVFIVVMLANKEFRRYVLETHKVNSEYSWTRFIGTVIVVSAVLIAMVQIASGKTVLETLILGMLGIALGSKVWQKTKENKDGSKEITTEVESNEKEEASEETFDDM